MNLALKSEVQSEPKPPQPKPRKSPWAPQAPKSEVDSGPQEERGSFRSPRPQAGPAERGRLASTRNQKWIFRVFGTAKRERGSFRGLDLLHGEEEFCAEAMFFLKSEEEIV